MTADAQDLIGQAPATEIEAPQAWSSEDEAALVEAVTALERTSFATRIGEVVGRQIGLAGELIPAGVAGAANAAAGKALTFAMRAARTTLSGPQRNASPRLHTAAVAASGAIGGAFGLATLPLELPISTTLILRSIGDIARQEGEDLSLPETELSCIEVFALGTGQDHVPFGESSYFATRTVLAGSISEAARYILRRGIIEETAPVVLRLFAQVAARFGLVVTQKVIAQSVPVIGAITGAAINAAFMDHYQKLARGHFVVRRLERRYGAAAVRAAYERVRARLATDTASPDRARTRPLPERGPGLRGPRTIDGTMSVEASPGIEPG